MSKEDTLNQLHALSEQMCQSIYDTLLPYLQGPDARLAIPAATNALVGVGVAMLCRMEADDDKIIDLLRAHIAASRRARRETDLIDHALSVMNQTPHEP